MSDVIRLNYWASVIRHLSATYGLRTLDDKQLDWATIERLAEGRGFKRINISKPQNMAKTVYSLFQIPNY